MAKGNNLAESIFEKNGFGVYTMTANHSDNIHIKGAGCFTANFTIFQAAPFV